MYVAEKLVSDGNGCHILHIHVMHGDTVFTHQPSPLAFHMSLYSSIMIFQPYYSLLQPCTIL